MGKSNRVRCQPASVSLARVAVACVWLISCAAVEQSEGPASIDREGSPASEPEHPGGSDWFVERAAEFGIDFEHVNGMSGKFYLPEIMGPGVALFDYDNDGGLDVFLVQGRTLGLDGTAGGDAGAPAGSPAFRGRLYHNKGPSASGDRLRSLWFTDVTEQSGIVGTGYGLGVATGDFTNDGCIDLYITSFGPNQLYRNNCDGTFTDVSAASRTDDAGFGVSAAFVDYDRDGWLDLYVGNYADYSIETDVRCISVTGGRDYCPPRTYGGQPDRLYHNRRDGTFLDVTAEALPEAFPAPALGVVTADFDGDGWIDIYVANDDEENLLWMNQGDGTFRDRAVLSGVAVNADGLAEASMGVDGGDLDNDGDEDLFVTHLTTETNTLYVNDGLGLFADRTAFSGLGSPSVENTGFGTAWLDFDNDGWLDLFVANGTVTRHVNRSPDDLFPYDQPTQLFRNLGAGRFEDVSANAGTAFRLSDVSRGAAFGDLDNDGDTDIVVANTNGPVRVFANEVGRQNHWVGVRLLGGERMPRDMLGARVAIVRNNEPTLWRRARADGSYASANDPRVLVGLGNSTKSPAARVMWPGGRVEEWPDLPIDRWTILREGSGR